MSDELIYRDPNNGEITSFSSPTPSLITTFDDKKGASVNAVEEQYLQISFTHPTTSEVMKSQVSAEQLYRNLMVGGEYVPNALLNGQETLLAADIAIDATTMTVEKSTFTLEGIEQNIFVADRPYLLMNRKPAIGESVFATGTENGLIKPAAEVVFIGSAYESGTSIPIVRSDPNAAARYKFAVIQAIPGVTASYGELGNKGMKVELERPDVVTMGTVTDGGSQTITAQFEQSSQQADTPLEVDDTTTSEYEGDSGLVTHYGVWVLLKADPFKYAVRGIPENCPPVLVYAIDSTSITTDSTTGNLQITGISQYWDPADGALKTITANKYWVAIRAMNSETFDSNMRISNAEFTSVTVA